jgi:hypothetical protein
MTVAPQTKIEELHQREFEWFIGKGIETPGRLTSEFYSYLMIQMTPEIFDSNLHYYKIPYYFEGKRIRKNLRTLARAPHFN